MARCTLKELAAPRGISTIGSAPARTVRHSRVRQPADKQLQLPPERQAGGVDLRRRWLGLWRCVRSSRRPTPQPPPSPYSYDDASVRPIVLSGRRDRYLEFVGHTVIEWPERGPGTSPLGDRWTQATWHGAGPCETLASVRGSVATTARRTSIPESTIGSDRTAASDVAAVRGCESPPLLVALCGPCSVNGLLVPIFVSYARELCLYLYLIHVNTVK